jgi:hypothetical protein
MHTSFGDWAALVRGKVRFDEGVQHPPRYQRQGIDAGDTPEMMLVPGKGMWDMFTTSSLACGVTQDYDLRLTGKDLDLLPVNAVKWQSLRAFELAGPQIGLPKLVRRVTVLTAEDEIAEPKEKDKSRGTSRWLSLLTYRVEMTITRANIRAGTVPTT